MTTKPTTKNIFIGKVHTEFRKSVLAKRATKLVSFIKELNNKKQEGIIHVHNRKQVYFKY